MSTLVMKRASQPGSPHSEPLKVPQMHPIEESQQMGSCIKTMVYCTVDSSSSKPPAPFFDPGEARSSSGRGRRVKETEEGQTVLPFHAVGLLSPRHRSGWGWGQDDGGLRLGYVVAVLNRIFIRGLILESNFKNLWNKPELLPRGGEG